MEDNVITYETFRKFQKQERDSDNLQKLPEDFFQSCAEWIKRKSKAYQETQDTMVIKELENVMIIIKDILDRRERKLLMMAMNTVRSDAVPRNLHPFEEKYFDCAVENIKKMRENVLKIIKDEASGEEPKKEAEEKLEESAKQEKIKEEIKEVPQEKLPKTRQEKSVYEPQEELPKIVEPPGFKFVRILDEIPKFLGTDGKAYGPFKQDDMVTLEERIAELLVEKGKAELFKS